MQQRPNIFTQKVANIEPGKRIDVNIRYFHTLAYEDGWYAFVFPTVVGPRFNPVGSRDPVGAVPREDFREPATGTAVRYLRPSERSAHDLAISVDVDAGVAIEELAATHAVATRRDGETLAHVELAGGSTIPNRDFVLKFRVAGEQIKSNLLTYTDAQTKQGTSRCSSIRPRLRRLCAGSTSRWCSSSIRRGRCPVNRSRRRAPPSMPRSSASIATTRSRS